MKIRSAPSGADPACRGASRSAAERRGFLSDWLNAEDIRGDLTDQHLEHNYTLTLREGEAQVDGTP
jgi:hypothetical protein